MTNTDVLAPEDPRSYYASAVGAARSVFAAVRTDQLDAATPCEEFDVRSMMGHVVGVIEGTAAIGRGVDPLSVSTIVESDDEAWSATLDEAARAVHSAWADDATLDREYTLPWATLPGPALLAMYTNEVLVHAWDVATAIGCDVEWPVDAVEVALAGMREGLPAEGRQEMFEEFFADVPVAERPANMPFAAAQPVADDAPLIDHLVAFNGRRP